MTEPPETKQFSKDRVEPGSVNIPVGKPPPNASSTSSNPSEVASNLIDRFNHFLSKKDYSALANLFIENGYWRDHLALSWDLRTLHGRDQIKGFLNEGARITKIDIDTSSEFRAPHFGAIDGFGDVQGIEFFVNVTTELGTGRGVVRLAENQGQWKISTLYTALHELKGHEEPVRHRRTAGVEHGGKADRKNWLERRSAEGNYEETSPTVLILGAGQGGLTSAARLKMLGVEALMIDSNDRVGDNWRKRYHQLVLHDPVWYDHLPYLNFPPHWPIFTPKDKLGDWFESYVKTMELNVWTQTTMTSATWDESKQHWTVDLQRRLPDGSIQSRTLNPRHIIQATGHSGKKNFPAIAGLSNFRGDRLCHSSEFSGANPANAGKKAVIVGCCNSGHDIAQDFFEKGYQVTMVQRSTTCVISSKAITDIGLKGLYDEDGPPVEDADLWLHGLPSELFKAQQIKVTAKQNEHDAEILEGLAKAGFALDTGPSGAGLFIKYFQRGGGYYIDVGASQLIIDGKIKIKQGQEIKEIFPHGIRFADDSEIEADEIVFATGYQNMRTQTRMIFGDSVADKVGDVWGFDKEGEMRTIWRQSGHPGFWFMGGNLALSRYYSRVLALQIKAIEEGITTYGAR